MDGYDSTSMDPQGGVQYDYDHQEHGQYPVGYGQHQGGYPYMPYNPYPHHYPFPYHYYPYMPYFPLWYLMGQYGHGGYPTPYGHGGYGGEREEEDDRLFYWGHNPYWGYQHHFFPFISPFGFVFIF